MYKNLYQSIIYVLNHATSILDIVTNSSYMGYYAYEIFQKMLLDDLNWLIKHDVKEDTIKSVLNVLNVISDILFHPI